MKQKRKKMLISLGIICFLAVIILVGIIGVSDDISKKIDLFFTDDKVVSLNDVKTTVTEKNELIYEFTLKNNSEKISNYKLYFDAKHKGVFEYVNMKVIRDDNIEFNGYLTDLTDENVFDISNIEPFEEVKYKIIFKGKRINFKFISTIKVMYSQIDYIPSKITISMPKNAKNEKNFTWHTKENEQGAVQIVKSNNETKTIADFYSEDVLQVVSNMEVNEFNDYVHKVKVANLEPGTEYYYRVGNPKNDIWSDVEKFVTDDGDDSFTFVYLTDLKSGEANVDSAIYTLNKAIETNSNTEFLLNTGDLVDNANNILEWNRIFKYNTFGTITNVVAVGNNDYDFIEYGGNIFNQHFNFDVSNDVNTESGAYYSFNYGNVHFTILNTNDYHWGELSNEQLEWLKKDLESSQQCDFRIVAMHRGLYTPGPHFYEYQNIQSLTKQLTSIFDKYNVDLVLQGHDHSYGLTYPINGKFEIEKPRVKEMSFEGENKNVSVMLKPSSPVYYINGAAGDKQYDTLVLRNGVYESINKSNEFSIELSNEEIDKIYSKFQVVDTPMDDETKLAHYSVIEVKGKTLIINTYSVNNKDFKEPKLYHSFGIIK